MSRFDAGALFERLYGIIKRSKRANSRMPRAGSLREKLTGDEAVMRRRWNAAGTGDPSLLVARAKRRNKNTLLIIGVGFVASLLLAVTNISPPPLPDMTRNPYGGETKNIDAEVTAEYEGKSVKKEVRFGILPNEADAAKVAASLDDLKERLPELMLGENSSLADVKYDLNLIEHDEKSGADIAWASDNEKAVAEDGRVNLIEGSKGDRATLSANIRLGEASDKFEADITIGDPPGGYDFTDDISESLDAVASELSGSSAGSGVELPEKTEGGVKLDWAAPARNTALFAPIVFLIIGIVMYRRRYAGIDREIAEARESVERDFPDFLDKLLLLLNAGVVVSSAISKITEDYRERREAAGEHAPRQAPRPKQNVSRKPEAADGSYFYDELCRMEDRIASSRVSLTSEFAELAVRTGRREVMRFSAILADNIGKGSALGEKLAQESNALWDMRKKSAEKKGRIAETKLTFPMVLQLVAIIIITVAPVAIEMK